VGLRSGLLDLDLDVDAGGKIEALQRVNRLGRGLEDVEEALVDAHLEVLPGVLGIGPRMVAWVRTTVSTIFFVD
jgi:hypothetical protein